MSCRPPVEKKSWITSKQDELAHVGDSNLKNMQPSNWIISPGIEGERTSIWRNHHQEIPQICLHIIRWSSLFDKIHGKKNVAHLGLSSRFFQSPSVPGWIETAVDAVQLKLPTATIHGTPAAQAINARFWQPFKRVRLVLFLLGAYEHH